MSRVIDPNVPLPKNTKYGWDECFAKIMLTEIVSKKFASLMVKECPDLQSEKYNVGVEVTTAVSEESLKIEGLYVDIEYGRVRNIDRAKNKIEKLGGKISNGILLHPVRTRSLAKLYNSYKKKIKLLNGGNYKVFKHNFIFITDVNLILEPELNRIIYVFVKIQEEYNNKFEKAFIYRYGGNLFELDLENRTYIVYTIPYDKACIIGEDAREMVVKKEVENKSKLD